MVKHSRIPAIGALLFATAIVSSGAWADTFERTMYLTFDHAVAVPGAELAPGAYIFERLNPATGGDIVRVSSRDRSRVYFSGFTRRIDRPAGLADDRAVLLGEAKVGAPVPVEAWFPLGVKQGHQFIYVR